MEDESNNTTLCVEQERICGGEDMWTEITEEGYLISQQ